MKGTVFMWKDIEYTVPVKGGERKLLDKVSGWIKPGHMTALMGSSGENFDMACHFDRPSV